MMQNRWDRREFLRMSGSTLLLLGGAGGGALEARDRAKPGVLVVLFQRGAADALHMVVPYRDKRYRGLRGALALEEPGKGETPTLDLGEGFAFHSALSPLYPLYGAGQLGVIVNTGSPDPTRSHFDAQDYMESGTPGKKSTRDGWLARALIEISGRQPSGAEAPSPFNAVALTPQMPRTLAGARDTIALEDFGSLERPRRESALAERLEKLYREDASASFAAAGTEASRAVTLFREQNPLALPPRKGVRYPGGRGENPLKQLAQLLKSGLGVRVAFVESSGWDTHFRQGAATGSMANLLGRLSGSLAAFYEDVGPDVPVTVLTVTEFGRTVAANGAGGTDHGHGSVTMVLGAGVRGGRVHGDWLGLQPRNLYEGRDLPVTTDFRDVFTEVATRALSLEDTSGLFPGYRTKSVGVMAERSL